MAISLERAYILGVYLGDGFAQWSTDDPSHCVYQFVVPSLDYDLLTKTARCIEKAFPELKGRVKFSEEPRTGKTKGKLYRLICHSKRLCRYLRKRTNIKQRLPRIKNPVVFREFMAGLMDTDGWITEWSKNGEPPRYQMGFAGTLPWVKEIRKLMQKHGVKVGTLQKQQRYNDNWNYCYRMYFNIASFIEAGFYFSIKRKQQRLDNWLKCHDESSTTERRVPNS